jgi:N-acetylmuramoyl-L-alanine amidase
MNLFARRAAALSAWVVAAAGAAGCQSTEPLEAPARPSPQLVSATDLAERLHIDRGAVDDTGKLVLSAPADGGEILLFTGTTVVTVNGAALTTSAPVELRGGEAWLSRDDAAAIESMWSSASAIDLTPWTPPVVRPLTLPPASMGPSTVPGGRASYAEQATAAEIRAWSVPLRRSWRYIVIHHSATDSGSAAQFDAAHKKRGWDGLGYDFVIDNGNGAPDGAVEVGFRWREQKSGAHAGPKNPRNDDGIGICLVGDFTKTRPTTSQMRALSRLCNFLSAYCGIPRENFLLHGDVRQTSCPGPLFPRDFISPTRRTAVAAARDDDLGHK